MLSKSVAICSVKLLYIIVKTNIIPQRTTNITETVDTNVVETSDNIAETNDVKIITQESKNATVLDLSKVKNSEILNI